MSVVVSLCKIVHPHCLVWMGVGVCSWLDGLLPNFCLSAPYGLLADWYHFYSPWYDPAHNRTHNLPVLRRTLHHKTTELVFNPSSNFLQPLVRPSQRSNPQPTGPKAKSPSQAHLACFQPDWYHLYSLWSDQAINGTHNLPVPRQTLYHEIIKLDFNPISTLFTTFGMTQQ